MRVCYKHVVLNKQLKKLPTSKLQQKIERHVNFNVSGDFCVL